jgi:fibronectin type 3 domain-containing protein
LGNDVFYNVPSTIPVYIPCGTYTAYRYSWYWDYFSNFIILAGYIELCMVSVDENYHNEIVWKKEDAVLSYNIYREGNIGGQYDLVANVPHAEYNSWTDTASDARIRSYRYKVSNVVSDCESELSDPHKTMHLTISAGQNNSWNLIWTSYEGVPYSTYNIYRSTGDTLGTMVLIGTMPSGNTSYTDFSVPAGYVYYMVEIVLDNPCNVWKSYSSIKSNIATNKSTVGLSEIEQSEMVKIYPNPTNDKFVIEYDNPVSLKLYDMLGKETFTQTINGKTEINISHLPQGVYSIQLISEGQVVGHSKIVKQ